MRPVMLYTLAVAMLPLAAVTPPGLRAQSRTAHIRQCARLDTLFGRLWRSHPSLVRVRWRGDTMAVRAPLRTASWETTSSRLVGTDAIALVPGGEARSDTARIELTLRFLDSIYRAPEQAPLELVIDDTLRAQFPTPLVDNPVAVKARGVPLVVKVLLTPAQSFALARAGKVTGTMGPFPFYLFSWELWDVNAAYRATVCGIE